MVLLCYSEHPSIAMRIKQMCVGFNCKLFRNIIYYFCGLYLCLRENVPSFLVPLTFNGFSPKRILIIRKKTMASIRYILDKFYGYITGWLVSFTALQLVSIRNRQYTVKCTYFPWTSVSTWRSRTPPILFPRVVQVR